MGLINITDLSDGTGADAGDINSRMATLTGVINGNIDSANISAGGVTTNNLASGAVTSTKLAPSKTVDANGWTVYDFGTWKKYSKRVTFSQSVTNGTITTLTVSSTNFPAGMANIDTKELLYSQSISSGFGSDAFITTDGMTLSTATAFAWSIRNNGAATRTYTGSIDISITER